MTNLVKVTPASTKRGCVGVVERPPGCPIQELPAIVELPEVITPGWMATLLLVPSLAESQGAPHVAACTAAVERGADGRHASVQPEVFRAVQAFWPEIAWYRIADEFRELVADRAVCGAVGGLPVALVAGCRAISGRHDEGRIRRLSTARGRRRGRAPGRPS